MRTADLMANPVTEHFGLGVPPATSMRTTCCSESVKSSR